MVELHSLPLGERSNQILVDDELLVAVLSGRLILMFAKTQFQELRHLEVRVTQQRRNAHDRRQHLRIESATAIAHQEVRPLPVNDLPDLHHRRMGVPREVRRDHLRLFRERLLQGQGRNALATCEESVKK